MRAPGLQQTQQYSTTKRADLHLRHLLAVRAVSHTDSEECLPRFKPSYNLPPVAIFSSILYVITCPGCLQPAAESHIQQSHLRNIVNTWYESRRLSLFLSACLRRWQGTPEVGRSRARSIAPVLVLGTCMIAVLYGNVSYYSESL